MGPVSRSAVSLRVIGDDLDPEEISDALGALPFLSHRKGENRPGRSQPTHIGLWRLKVADRTPADVDDQVQEIFGKLTSNLEIWKKISTVHKIDLYVTLFLTDTNQGLELSASSLDILSKRGVILGLDIYGPEYLRESSDA